MYKVDRPDEIQIDRDSSLTSWLQAIEGTQYDLIILIVKGFKKTKLYEGLKYYLLSEI